MKNKIFAVIAIALCISMMMLSFAACSSEDKTDDSGKSEAVAGGSQQTEDTGEATDSYTVKAMALKGPTGMGMSYLMDGKGNGSYEITLASAPDEVVSAFTSGSIDVAAVPVNLAPTLYNKLDGEVRLLDINTLGVLYILENGEKIESIEDLAGKTIHATGQGSTPEYVINYILEKNDLDDVEFKYYADHAELTTLMSTGEVKLGMLPEPNVTTAMSNNKELRIALDLTQEWEKVSDAELAQGCIIASKDFVEEHEDAVKLLLEDCEAAVAFIEENPEEAAESIANNGILAKASLAKKAIPNCNIVAITGDKMVSIAENMFEVLYDINPKSIGGKLPGEDFYYNPAE